MVLFAFAIGNPTLREIEASCQYDIRFFHMLGGQYLDHTTISRFINKVILPRRNEIFSRIMKTIFDKYGIGMETCFIDSTKQEAKPNKNKFVWNPTTYHDQLCDKARGLLKQMRLSDNIPSKGIFKSSLIAEKISIAEKMGAPSGISKKTYCKITNSPAEYLVSELDYEEKEDL